MGQANLLVEAGQALRKCNTSDRFLCKLSRPGTAMSLEDYVGVKPSNNCAMPPDLYRLDGSDLSPGLTWPSPLDNNQSHLCHSAQDMYLVLAPMALAPPISAFSNWDM